MEDDTLEKGEERVMKTEEMEDFIGEVNGSRGEEVDVELAPSGARHGKPQLGYLQYCA